MHSPSAKLRGSTTFCGVSAALFCIPLWAQSHPPVATRQFLWLEANDWVAVLTGLLFVATLALAIYTAKLFRTTVELGEEAKATSARAVGLSETQIKSFHTVERAWVGMLHVGHGNATKPGEDGKPINGYVLQVTFINTGRTPAMNAVLFSRLKVRPTASEPAPTFTPDTNENPEPMVMTPGVQQKTPPRFLSESDGHQILMEKAEAFFYALIRYNDVFSEVVRETAVCFRVDITGTRGDNRVNWEFSPAGGAQNNRAS
jgi:hypothetical protein